MHTNQTYNSLTIDSAERLKFPPEISQYLNGYDWSEVVWNTFGLPGFHCGFSLVGDQLYFEHDASGKVSLKQSDFTGQTLISSVLTPEECDKVFVVTFELTFCLGKLCQNEITEFKTNPRAEYDRGFNRFAAIQERKEKISKTWIFRYLYRPYFYVIKYTTITLIFVLQLLSKTLIWCAERLTPIKLS